ncbi:hypothetical protein SR187_8825 [Streptococcus ruminantium]|uniref:Uncharacterized protein n=1 Tax=Streptococcus ruminantium TaxID=1917441 RepID=A0A2Z5U5G8_9STRE|nr:hypothetical protein SR187_8825 [Streptococcus ruminantium]
MYAVLHSFFIGFYHKFLPHFPTFFIKYDKIKSMRGFVQS